MLTCLFNFCLSRRASAPHLLRRLGGLLCLASAGCYAATPAPARATAPATAAAVKPAAATLAQSQPPSMPLGLKLDVNAALSEDDCEEDYDDLQAAAAGTAPRPASAATATTTATTTAATTTAATAAAAAEPSLVAVVAVPAPAAVSVPLWEVTPADKTINAVLSRWAASAGWQLVWELPVDFAVSVRTELRGTFQEAVGQVVKSMANGEVPMKAIFYEGNHVLRVVAKGNE